jgi:hypothetical protein
MRSEEFIEWYCSEPRLAFNKTVVTRYRISLEQQHYASTTINLRLAAVRRLAYEAADCGLLSADLAAAKQNREPLPSSRPRCQRTRGKRVWLPEPLLPAKARKEYEAWFPPPSANVSPVELNKIILRRGRRLSHCQMDSANQLCPAMFPFAFPPAHHINHSLRVYPPPADGVHERRGRNSPSQRKRSNVRLSRIHHIRQMPSVASG